MKHEQVYKDYKNKILNKIYGNKENQETIEKVSNVNDLIVFFNYCFHKRNNFFIEDFNRKSIYKICESYNKLKSNVLSTEPVSEVWEIFSGIEKDNIKTLKFIIYRFLGNYENISKSTDRDDVEFVSIINKKSIESCLKHLEKYSEALDK